MGEEANSERSGSDDNPMDLAMRSHMNPGTVDQSVRQALQMMWMILPSKKKHPDEVERQFRRIVDRALRDMRGDFDEFHF